LGNTRDNDYVPPPEYLVCANKRYVNNKHAIEKNKYLIRDPEKSISLLFSADPDQIVPCDSLPKYMKNLIIFDDVVNLSDQKLMKLYFTRGRHNNCNTIYISQTIYSLDKHSIRNNSNGFIFFELGKRDKSCIFSDLITFRDEEINNQYKQAILDHWNRAKYNYIYYDRTTKKL